MPYDSNMIRTRLGFTLIELLVVIAIIALLVGILLPTLASARLSAQSLACGAKLKQIGIATSMYLDDFNNALPQVLVEVAPGFDSPVGALFGGQKGQLPFLGIDEYGAERRPLNSYLADRTPLPDAQEGIDEMPEFESPLDRGSDDTGLPIPQFSRTDSMYDLIGSSYTLNDHAPDNDPSQDVLPTLVPQAGGPMPYIVDTSRTLLIASQTIYNYDDGGDRKQHWYAKQGRSNAEIAASVLFADFHVGVRLPVPDDRSATTRDYTFLPRPSWDTRTGAATARGGRVRGRPGLARAKSR